MRKRLQSSCAKPDVQQNSGKVPADPGVCTVPIRIGKATIYVREGDDIEEKRKLWEKRLQTSGMILRY